MKTDCTYYFIGQNSEAAAIVASLREVIHSQAQEIEALNNKLKETLAQNNEVRSPCICVFSDLLTMSCLQLKNKQSQPQEIDALNEKLKAFAAQVNEVRTS